MLDPLQGNDSPNGQPLRVPQPGETTSTKEFDSELFLRKAFEQNPRQGLELLFRRYYNPLCSHAVRFVYSRTIAEDLVSEVFFQFYRTKAYLNIRSSYTSYLFRAVRNEAFTHVKREFGRHDALESTPVGSLSADQPQPDAEAQFNHLYWKINESIGQLPAQCQRAFLMSRFENKKYHEIADELNISPKTVEVHISKALKYLRQALRSEWLMALLLLSHH